jgi:hypothetical protein
VIFNALIIIALVPQPGFGGSSGGSGSRRARGLQGRQWGVFGEPRVNVLLLNVDLDQSVPLRK